MRVGDVPRIKTSRGTTRIYLEGTTIWEPQPEPREKSAPVHDSGGTSFGVVYANEAARKALKAGGAPKFPAGSIIVRETRANPGDERPLLVVAMVKRTPGFNPMGGDWEFLAVDPSLEKFTGRQKKGSCLGCHASQRERDFVFPTPAAK